MATTADLPMTIRIYSASGTFICEFPQFVNLQVLDCINDVPAFTLDWALNAPNALNLISDSDLQVAVCMDFRDGNGYTETCRFLYEQDTYDPSMNESAIVQANGRGTIALLDQAIVYPQGGVGNTTTFWAFVSASPGKIMHDLITAAQTRGCFPGLSMSFTTGQDSSGNAWTEAFTYSYNAGTSLLTVATGLMQAGLCDGNMTGTTLNLYNPGTTLATDRSTTVFVRRGREVVQMPTQRDRTQIGTVMLAIGDNGVNVERTASTYGSLGRREKYLAQQGVTDTGTLDFWADQALGAIDDQQIAYTPGYIADTARGTPVPWKDYHPGDYLGLDVSGTALKYRARQWVVQCTAGGPTSVQPTLNDVFYDRNVLVQGQIGALSGGSVTGGPAPTITNLPGPNATVPNPPAFVPANIYTGAYYSPATGTTLAQLELNWTTPTNTDGTPVNDGMQYIVQYKISTTPIYPLAWTQLQGKSWSSINGNPWTNPLATPQNTQWTTVSVPFDNNNLIVSELICGETYQFQIATTDVSGNTSLFSSVSSFVTARDNVAPSQPDAPTVFASMVAVQVMSDLGRASGGTYNLEQDLDHLEVHYSYDPAFTAVPGVGSPTYLGKLIANAGMMQAGIAAVGTFNVTSVTGIYIRVIAVDESGNSSPASPSSGVTAVLIDDTHISSLSVSKLLAGTIMATIILGSTISTASSGARVAMDGSTDALYTYDTNGSLIGVWAGKPGIDPSDGVAFNAGWTIFNDPFSAGAYVSVVSNTSGGGFSNASPQFKLSSIAGNLSTVFNISAIGNTSEDLELTSISGSTSSGDPNAGWVQANFWSGSNAPSDASYNLQWHDTNGTITRFDFDRTDVHITQGTSGGTTIQGNPIQNTGGAGLAYRCLHHTVESGTTNGSGVFTFNHGAPFTPVFGFVMPNPGGFYQGYLGGFTSTQATVTVYSPSGALLTGTLVSFWMTLIGF